MTLFYIAVVVLAGCALAVWRTQRAIARLEATRPHHFSEPAGSPESPTPHQGDREMDSLP
jgi:hypothetical protein